MNEFEKQLISSLQIFFSMHRLRDFQALVDDLSAAQEVIMFALNFATTYDSKDEMGLLSVMRFS